MSACAEARRRLLVRVIFTLSTIKRLIFRRSNRGVKGEAELESAEGTGHSGERGEAGGRVTGERRGKKEELRYWRSY